MVVRKAETVHSRPRHNNSGVGLLCDTSCCHREISSGAVRSELRPSCWDTHHSLLRGRLVSATTPEPINASTRACANPNSSNTWRNTTGSSATDSTKGQHSRASSTAHCNTMHTNRCGMFSRLGAFRSDTRCQRRRAAQLRRRGSLQHGRIVCNGRARRLVRHASTRHRQ